MLIPERTLEVGRFLCEYFYERALFVLFFKVHPWRRDILCCFSWSMCPQGSSGVIIKIFASGEQQVEANGSDEQLDFPFFFPPLSLLVAPRVSFNPQNKTEY